MPADVPREDFDSLLRNRTPILDLRAPIEFDRGRAPAAENLPLLADSERSRVGTLYRQAGPDAALSLGHELVSGDVRRRRMETWISWCDAHPDGVLCCFRGGQRSHVVQRWLAEAGRPRALVAGGYKAIRAHLVMRLAELGARVDLLVVGGRTGSGKTELLVSIPRHLDLEGLARHRGSAFGARIDGQPSLADFENRIAVELLRRTAESLHPIAIEDEARNVGRLTVPLELYENLCRSEIALVDVALEDRVRTTLRAYVLDACHERQRVHGEDAGFEAFALHLTESLDRIRKRVGHARHAQLRGMLEDALACHRHHGEVDAHRAWIEKLLVEYYDPMYDFQLSKSSRRIAFRGDPDAVCAWIRKRVQS